MKSFVFRYYPSTFAPRNLRMLHFRADIKTVLYFFIITALFVIQWQYGFHWWLYIIYLHFAVSVAVITHNHSHVNMWKSKVLNILTDWWLTVFYGLPIFVWIPTHNRNHHKFNNKVGDTSLTYRTTEENNLVTLLSYPSVSGYYQMKDGIIPYMKSLRVINPSQFRQNIAMIVVLLVWVVTALVISWKKALLYVILPHQVAQYSVIIFNYVQHVHADEESKYNHSRNFMGVNFFLFNNGYHTIHHEKAVLHWSQLPEAHKSIHDKIDPSLIEPSFYGFIIKTYILGLFIPKFRTKSMRLKRMSRAKAA